MRDSALLGHYAAYGGNYLPTFRQKPVGPILKGQISLPLKMGLIDCS